MLEHLVQTETTIGPQLPPCLLFSRVAAACHWKSACFAPGPASLTFAVIGMGAMSMVALGTSIFWPVFFWKVQPRSQHTSIRHSTHRFPVTLPRHFTFDQLWSRDRLLFH